MAQQVPVGRAAVAGGDGEGGLHEVAPDLAYQRLAIVNVAFCGSPGGPWVLIDAGVMGSRGALLDAVERRFGGDPPSAIVLTHGHFDHVGCLEDLACTWDVPVYAHHLEESYLNGRAAYPPPDPTVGGGLMARLSPLFPRGPVDVAPRLRALPVNGSVPSMPGWRWLHTPGHTPGHVAFWRESDRALIAGDAFVTTAQESVYAVVLQKPELHGPPMYYTQDFTAAGRSVRLLAKLDPELVVTGHGRAMRGPEMRVALHALADGFERIAVPKEGRYVRQPARPGAPNPPYRTPSRLKAPGS